MKKSTFLPKFHFFFTKWHFDRSIVTLPQSLYDIILSLYLEFRSFAQKQTLFLHKMLFFTKRKQRHQKLTLFKNRIYFFNQNLISPLKTNIFENGDHLVQKWKNPSKLVFLQDFRFYQWSTHNEKINTS